MITAVHVAIRQLSIAGASPRRADVLGQCGGDQAER